MNGHRSPAKPFALVVWDDAHGNSDEDVFESDIHHSAERYHSYGWLVRSDKDGVTLAGEWCPSAGSYRGTMFIPRGMIAEEMQIVLSKKRDKKAGAAVEKAAAPILVDGNAGSDKS